MTVRRTPKVYFDGQVGKQVGSPPRFACVAEGGGALAHVSRVPDQKGTLIHLWSQTPSVPVRVPQTPFFRRGQWLDVRHMLINEPPSQGRPCLTGCKPIGWGALLESHMIRPHNMSTRITSNFFLTFLVILSSSSQASVTACQLGWSFLIWGLIRHRVNRLLPQDSLRATCL